MSVSCARQIGWGWLGLVGLDPEFASAIHGIFRDTSFCHVTVMNRRGKALSSISRDDCNSLWVVVSTCVQVEAVVTEGVDWGGSSDVSFGPVLQL